jgi:hypothetical protein
LCPMILHVASNFLKAHGNLLHRVPAF